MGELEVELKEYNVYLEGMGLVMERMMLPDADNVIDLNVWNVFDDEEMNHYQTYFHLLDPMSNNSLYLEEIINIDLYVYPMDLVFYLDCLVNVVLSKNNHWDLDYVEWNFAKQEIVLCNMENDCWWNHKCHLKSNDVMVIGR